MCEQKGQIAILAVKNKDTDDLNTEIQNQINGQIHSFSPPVPLLIQMKSSTIQLNSLDLPGLLPHNLQLKVGSGIIMLGNLNQAKLCNGIRPAVKNIMKNLIEATIIIGKF